MQVLNLIFDNLRVREARPIDNLSPSLLHNRVGREPLLKELLLLAQIDRVVAIGPCEEEVQDVDIGPFAETSCQKVDECSHRDWHGLVEEHCPLDVGEELALVGVQDLVISTQPKELLGIAGDGFEDPSCVTLVIARLHVEFVLSEPCLLLVGFFQLRSSLLLGPEIFFLLVKKHLQLFLLDSQEFLFLFLQFLFLNLSSGLTESRLRPEK